MSVLSDVAGVLVSSGLGIYNTTLGSIDSTIFTHDLPPEPQAAISIQVYGYAPNGAFLFDDVLPVSESPRIHITVRDPDADTCEARCYTAWKALIGLSDVALGGVHYFSIRNVHGPIDLQRDENNLWLYAADVQATKGFD